MNNWPLVSIIIPNYNYADYLAEAIDSCLGQTYKKKEVVVVDDGSTDTSRKILQGYGQNIMSVYQKNKGLASARNRGIEESNGELLLFLDSDDFILEDALENLVNVYLGKKQTCIVYGDSYFLKDTKLQENKRKTSEGRIFYELLKNNFLCIHEAIVPAVLFKQFGTYDESLSMAEDYDFWLRISKHIPFFYLRKPVAVRRIHDKQMIHNRIELLSWHLKVLEKQRNVSQDLRSKIYLNKSIASTYHEIAYFQKRDSNFKEMSAYTVKSLKANPFYWKNYVYLFLSVLGKQLWKTNRK